MDKFLHWCRRQGPPDQMETLRCGYLRRPEQVQPAVGGKNLVGTDVVDCGCLVAEVLRHLRGAYMQMAQNIRRHKGVRPIPVLHGLQTLQMDGTFAAWDRGEYWR